VEGSCEHGNEPSGYIQFWKNSGVAERLTASHEALRYVELL
jgi:hypothetical protein